MTDLPLHNGRLPVKWPPAGTLHGRVPAWKIWRYIDALVVGVGEPIDDKMVGRIEANVPLPMTKAARAVGVHLKKARALQLDPEFGEAVKRAVEAYRACLEPRVIAMALGLMEDRTVSPRERIRAGECLRGPKPAQGVTVNVAQNNGQTLVAPAGYVVDLTPKPLNHEPPKTIDVTPRQGNVGDAAADVAKERAEAHQFRPR